MTKKKSDEETRSGSRHVKLISASPSRSSERVVPPCRTLQQNGNFSPYGDVCMTLPTNDAYVFSLPLEEAGRLDRGMIGDELRREFAANGSQLSCAARLKVQYPGRVWFIVDPDRKYSVRMVPTGLLVYSERL